MNESTGYYGIPMLHEPVWTWDIPAYFYVGGVSGASAVLGALLRVADARSNGEVISRCLQISAAGSVVSAILLIHDLGRPARFLYMLRVFRPTSPMSVGSWILAGFGAAATGAWMFRGPVGMLAQFAAALLGLPLSTYTAVLVSNTAVPVWRASRHVLPFLFAGSAMAGAASMLELTVRQHSRPVAMLAAAGGVTELAASSLIPIEGLLWNAAKAMSAASLVLSIWPRTSRAKRIAFGVLGTAAAIAFRFAIVNAGRKSSRATSGTGRPGSSTLAGPAYLADR